ncbi:dephospho-CoA kinase [Pseudoalteromonas luteoviolacea]|uniref:dephospho-CoA kinase n=1 Tax=Pseudoalteromonas luteoviolacea TaxID=43657 RepID=UPI00115052A6|nr:dephospho-CoA kinase [Pseudoalteromonas luteoviolacea]TQF66748.1 dephospho-CoA kinase [Pseudoalteromonas luteoviolacea]
MSKWILGLTGGIGAGKTAATNYFQSLGIDVIDADIVAREVVMPNTEGLKAITAHFGQHILTEQGELDRAKLREIIFSDEAKKNWLNELLHPLIRAQIVAQLAAAKSSYSILCAPLLFENGLQSYCQKTLLIDVPESVQIARTTARDSVSQNQVQNIIAAQMSRTEKTKLADYIVNNDRDIVDVQSELLSLHQLFLQAAQNY